jgi:plastocyanin
MVSRHQVALSLTLAIVALIGFSACSKSKSNPAAPTPTVEPFESGDLATAGPTSIFVHTFNATGSFDFRCRHHPSMTGTIQVIGGGADSIIIPMGNFFFTAPSGPVKPGGYVKWVNGSGLHTVTRP